LDDSRQMPAVGPRRQPQFSRLARQFAPEQGAEIDSRIEAIFRSRAAECVDGPLVEVEPMGELAQLEAKLRARRPDRPGQGRAIAPGIQVDGANDPRPRRTGDEQQQNRNCDRGTTRYGWAVATADSHRSSETGDRTRLDSAA